MHFPPSQCHKGISPSPPPCIKATPSHSTFLGGSYVYASKESNPGQLTAREAEDCFFLPSFAHHGTAARSPPPSPPAPPTHLLCLQLIHFSSFSSSGVSFFSFFFNITQGQRRKKNKGNAAMGGRLCAVAGRNGRSMLRRGEERKKLAVEMREESFLL